jgi:transposase
MVSYSSDLRIQLLGEYDRGMTTHAIAQAFAVSTGWARRVRQSWREHGGELGPRPRVGPRKFKIDPAKLGGLVQSKPDATLVKPRERLGIEYSLSAVWKSSGILGCRKKNHPY